MAVVAACGWRPIPLAHPIVSWPILAVSGRGLLLVAVVREWPHDLGRFRLPGSFPPGTLKLVHKWGDAPCLRRRRCPDGRRDRAGPVGGCLPPS